MELRIHEKLDEILSLLKNIKKKSHIKYVDLTEASEICGLSKSTLRRRMADGSIPYSDKNGKHIIQLLDLERWLS